MKRYDAQLISSTSNINYISTFSGFSETEREAFIIITKNKKFLITDQRYSEAVKIQTKDFEIIDSGAINFISQDAKSFFKEKGIKTLGFEENNLTVWEFNKLIKIVNMIPLDLSNLRIIKNETEIKYIKKSCKIGDHAFKHILSKLKVGISEKQISEELISFFQQNQATYSFKPIVAFGVHSSVPHHETSNTKLKQNQIVLLDFGVKVNGYCSDMSRTIFYGQADDKFKKIYNTVLKAQNMAIKKINININASKIDKEARNFILKNNFPNIVHAVGHGIGLEVHESPAISPVSRDKIKNGMVFSIEPGIYIPRYGGVRIEDLVLVNSDNTEVITNANKNLINLNN